MDIISLIVEISSIFTPISSRIRNWFDFLREPLKKAKIRYSLIGYLNLMLFIMLVSVLISVVVAYLLSRFFIIPEMYSTFIFYILPFMVSITILLLFVYYPYQKMDAMKSKIENTLPFALSHMASIAESGAPPYVIFKIISGFKEYEGVSEEFKEIVRRVEVYGVDLVTAIRDVAKRTPSSSLRKVLYGIVSTMESGGDLKGYLKTLGDQSLFEWRIKRQKYIQQLSTYSEIYIGVIVAAPLFLIAIFAIMNMIQGNIAGMSIIDVMKLSVYGIIPFLNLAFLIFLKGTEVEM